MALGEPKPFPKQAQLARTAKRYKRKVASAKRWQQIFEAKQGPCRVCAAPPPNQMAHLVSRAHGGSDTEANVVPLCQDCHRLFDGYDQETCEQVAASLTDAEYALCVERLSEGGWERRFRVRFKRG